MARRLVLFLGKPRRSDDDKGSGPARYQKVAYRFDADFTSAPVSFFGLSLFDYLVDRDRRPEEVIVFGTRSSQWDSLRELSEPANEEQLQALIDVGDAVRDGAVSREHLDDVEQALVGRLDGVDVQCRLIGRAADEEEQLEVMRSLAEHAERDDVFHLDVTHGFRHLGLVALESLLFLRQVRSIEIGGVYYGQFASMTDGVVPVVSLNAVDRLADWSEALATFRQTGMLGALPDLFAERHTDISKPLETLKFALGANRIERAAGAAVQARANLMQLCGDGANGTLAGFFADQLVEELEVFTQSHMADWQLEFARRAFEHGDYMRCAVLAYEAILSAAIGDEEIRKDGRERMKVDVILKDNGDQQPTPFDNNDKYWKLSNIRNALAHGTDSYNSRIDNLVSDEHRLRSYLGTALNYAEETVEEFKSDPPC